MCDIHYKDTLCTIEDAKRAADLGAVGVQVASLIFNDPTQDDILWFFEDLRNHLLRMEPPRYLQPALLVISNNWPTSCYSAVVQIKSTWEVQLNASELTNETWVVASSN